MDCHPGGSVFKAANDGHLPPPKKSLSIPASALCLSGYKTELVGFICHIRYCSLFLLLPSSDSGICCYRLSFYDVPSIALSP